MKSFLLFCVICILCFNVLLIEGALHKAKNTSSIENVETINKLADVIFSKIGVIVKSLDMDPFKAPNQSQHIAVAQLDLTNIQVFHISTIKRKGNLTLLNDNAKDMMTLEAKLAFDELKIVSDYKVSSKMPLVPASTGAVTAKVIDLYVDIEIYIDFQKLEVSSSDPIIKLDDKLINVKFSKTFAAVLLTPVSILAANLFKVVIEKIIEKLLGDNLKKILKQASEMVRNIIQNFG